MKNTNILRDLIRILGKNIGALEKGEMMCCGVTIGQCYAILEIGLAGEISLIDLANLLNLDKSTMSRTVNNLVQQELVERITDQSNRRYIKIKLTKLGQHALDKINTVFDAYLKSVFADISENKREQVIESLEIFIEALQNNPCCDR